MTINELIKGNHEIVAVEIEFRREGKLMGEWKIGAEVGYTQNELNCKPDWCKDVPNDEFFRVTRKSINFYTDGREYWGYNNKLPKEAAELEVNDWTCWYSGLRNRYNNSAHKLIVTVEEAVPEIKKPVEEADVNQINLFDIGGM